MVIRLLFFNLVNIGNFITLRKNTFLFALNVQIELMNKLSFFDHSCVLHIKNQRLLIAQRELAVALSRNV